MSQNSVRSAQKAKKASAGSFKPGKSGNPGGRPKKTPEELNLIEACKNRTPAALAVIEGIMIDGQMEKNRLSAALAIIERAYGKAVQPVDATVTGEIEMRHKLLMDCEALREKIRGDK